MPYEVVSDTYKLDMYLKFRQELDKMCVPVILENVDTEMILHDGKIVGMLCSNGQYIDCLYVLPEYRKKGLAKKAILEWYERHESGLPVRLHIINNNKVALKFWNSLFLLTKVESNPIDTLYEIICRRENNERTK